jgi:hypothetical protein
MSGRDGDGAMYRGSAAADRDLGADLAVDLAHCQGCGEPVSDALRRVCGDDDDVAHACIECVDTKNHLGYAASGREVSWP